MGMYAKDRQLFDEWVTNPIMMFQGFVQSAEFVRLGKASLPPGMVKILSRKSQQCYVAMFTKFARWMNEEHVNIRAITRDHILRFLDASMRPRRKGAAKDLNSVIRRRYVNLLERVFAHIGLPENPARQAWMALFDNRGDPAQLGKEADKQFLTIEQQERFMLALSDVAPSAEGESRKAWRRRRDRAMMAMMIGAGLTASEVLAMRLSESTFGDPEEDGSIPVKVWAPTGSQERERKKDAPSQTEHLTKLRPVAVAYVMEWLAERQKMRVDGALLFPRKSTGPCEQLDPAILYRQVKATLAAAGIKVLREGGRTLRNTYAQRELENGADLETLKGYLGLHDMRSIERYVMGDRRLKPAP